LTLARIGFRVTGLDDAPAAVETLQARLAEEGLAAEVVEADVLAWEPAAPFAAVYEQTCLCALPPAVQAWATSYRRRPVIILISRPTNHLRARSSPVRGAVGAFEENYLLRFRRP
jgi:hypothetical protein